MTFPYKRTHAIHGRSGNLALQALYMLFLLLAPLACTPANSPTSPADVTSTETAPATSTAEFTPTTQSATATLPPASDTPTTQPSTPVGPLVSIAEADTLVQQSDPDKNFGEGETLRADGSGDAEIESFLRFTVSGISGPIQAATLRVYVNDNATEDGPAVYGTETSWAESEITWNRRPAQTGDAIDNRDYLSPNAWAEYDVTSLVTGDGSYSFALIADSSDGVVFSSREGNQPPQLVITLLGSSPSTLTPTSTPMASEGEAVLVGAGDISTCNDEDDELTAQLLDAIPGTVFTVGDNAYSNGTYNEYINCYDPTWGRHKDRTRPVPGNHEYHTDGAAGYFQYFDNIPSYYAYDLADWRIYALNSEIDTSLTSPQMIWLIADLAANPRQCVLAYWHRPRWSSGSYHGNDGNMQGLWEILYAAGAELVINGHEHNYERFAEMNTKGEITTPGLREIVVGTGGRDHYDFDTPKPASEVRDASAFGVLKLTLHPDSYEWEFVPVPGSSFTDSGSTACH